MTYITAEGKHTVYSSEESLAQAFIRYTNLELNDIKHSFIKIGFRLAEAKRYGYHKELGYKDIFELAEKEFDFKSTVAYNLMQIWRFAHDKQSPMEIDKRFDKFSQSQLLEMSRSKHDFDNYRLAAIIPETATKEEIRKIIKEWNRWECVSNLSNAEILKVLNPPLIEEKAEESEQEIFHPGGKTEKVLQEPSAPVPARSTEEVINECLRRSGYKDTIYQKYLAQPSREEFIKFLKDLHGNQGESWSCGVYFFRDYSPSKGITLMGHNCPSLVISWSIVASRIRKLIEAKQYLTEDELNLNPDKPAPRIPDWTNEEPEEAEAEELAEPEEVEEQNFSTQVENTYAPELTPRRQQTRREYLATLPDEEFATQILLQVARIYPLGKNSADFISTMRKRLKEWFNEPHEVTE